ncbi:MAG: hypothetical protein JWP89_6874 [Schlesneria sp.]|nr:hypothetical protein [Schlesneria sp.]
MSRSRLNSLVATATGESSRTIRQRGFSLLRLDVPFATPAPQLCLSCPGCGADVQLTSDRGSLPEWAECEQCDIAYPYEEHEVFLPDHDLAESALTPCW